MEPAATVGAEHQQVEFASSRSVANLDARHGATPDSTRSAPSVPSWSPTQAGDVDLPPNPTPLEASLAREVALLRENLAAARAAAAASAASAAVSAAAAAAAASDTRSDADSVTGSLAGDLDMGGTTYAMTPILGSNPSSLSFRAPPPPTLQSATSTESGRGHSASSVDLPTRRRATVSATSGSGASTGAAAGGRPSSRSISGVPSWRAGDARVPPPLPAIARLAGGGGDAHVANRARVESEATSHSGPLTPAQEVTNEDQLGL